MHLVLPAARSLRSLYSLGAERLWFALAVMGGLILAGEVLELAMMLQHPPLDLLGY